MRLHRRARNAPARQAHPRSPERSCPGRPHRQFRRVYPALCDGPLRRRYEGACAIKASGLRRERQRAGVLQSRVDRLSAVVEPRLAIAGVGGGVIAKGVGVVRPEIEGARQRCVKVGRHFRLLSPKTLTDRPAQAGDGLHQRFLGGGRPRPIDIRQHIFGKEAVARLRKLLRLDRFVLRFFGDVPPPLIKPFNALAAPGERLNLICLPHGKLSYIVHHMETYKAPLDASFHALADPTRRAVINRLVISPAPVKKLAEPFDIGLPTFLKHLRVLEDSGLIATSKVGRIRTCRVNIERLVETESWLSEQRALWQARTTRLAEYVETHMSEDNENDG